MCACVCGGGGGGGVGEGVVRAKSIRVDGCMVVCLVGGNAVWGVGWLQGGEVVAGIGIRV